MKEETHMLKKLTIRWKLIVLIIAALTITAGTISGISIYNLNANMNAVTEERVKDFRDAAYQAKKNELETAVGVAIKTVESFYARTDPEKVKERVQQELKNHTEIVLSMLEEHYRKNRDLPKAQLQKEILGMIAKSRYGQDGYFWVNDTDLMMVMHPIKPALNGRDLRDMEDTNGKKFFREMVQKAGDNGSGFVDYTWPKPGFDKPQPKVSYVALFKPFNWVIGTGVYVEDITAVLQKEALQTVANMRFGEDGKNYFWINDSKPAMVMHPVKPELDGENLSGIKDPDGKALFVEMVHAVKETGRGFVEYIWDKPGSSTPQPKISFVQYFPEWDWIIGAGVYTDDVEAHVKTVADKTGELILEIAVYFILTTIGLIILMSGFMGLVGEREITRPIQLIVRHIMDGSRQVSAASTEIAGAATSLADGASQQAADVEEITATIETSLEMNRNSAENAREANETAAQTRKLASAGNEEIKKLITSMNGISDSSQEISKIIRTIDEIAFQTNLLALNAAVEAARAGEHGLGFAVVADEVKSLAQRSAHAARETAEIIERSLDEIKAGNVIAGKTDETFSAILEQIEGTYRQINAMTGSLEEQSNGMEEIAKAISAIDQITQQNAATSEESAAAAEELNAQAVSMNETVTELAKMAGYDLNKSDDEQRAFLVS